MLLLFRVICAIFVAWAMSWAVARPEASLLVEEVDRFASVAPVAGGLVGFFTLSKRQGWGVIVAVANGLWAGVLSLLFTTFILIFLGVREASQQSLEFDFDHLMRVMSEETQVIVDHLSYLPFVVIAVTATAVVGIVTEIIHWALVRMRKRRNNTNGRATDPHSI